MQITLTDFKLMYCLKYVNVFLDKPYFNVIQVYMSFFIFGFFLQKKSRSSFDPHHEKSCIFGKSKTRVN